MAACLVLALCSWDTGSRLLGGVETDDPRNIRNGRVIPDEGYCDQPYIVVSPEGHWLCVMTTGRGEEGQRGQHIVSTISTDQGRTWSELVDIEPADGPEASWATPLVTPAGRVYVFYDYNGDRVHRLGDRENIRADMLGWYCYKYSDDFGRSWSKRRYRLPVRRTACDETNDWQGRVQIFWGIDKPSVLGSSVLFAFTKLGAYMLEKGEGWFFRSDNILTEPDPDKIEWEMLPEGDRGLRADHFGSVQEEHNIVPLNDGSLYCIYRTTLGHPVHAYSRDGARHWTEPTFATHRSDVSVSRPLKTPRACPKLFKTKNGKYLLWFHNHGGRSFADRNPAWICGGIEENGYIRWLEPEILLYDPDPRIRMSYPDLVEQDGRYWITETNKHEARVHEIDPDLLEGLWNQDTNRTVAEKGLVLSLPPGSKMPAEVPMPRLPSLGTGWGLTLEFWVRLDDLSPGQVVLDARDPGGKGLAVTTTQAGTVRIVLNDGTNTASWDCDPGLLRPGNLHHVGFVVDAGPKIITVLVDGLVCDGGPYRQYGWGRFSPQLGDINGGETLKIAPSLRGELVGLRLYDRCLRHSEVIANYKSYDALPPRILADKTQWTASVRVRLESPLPGRQIRYTLDGSEPTYESEPFVETFEIHEDTVVRACLFWDGGRRKGRTATAIFKRTPPQPARDPGRVAPGLICRYYEQHLQKMPDFAAMEPVWTRTVETFGLPPGMRDIHCALVFEGYIAVPRDGMYTFYTQSDDGSVLCIGDTKVVDNDGVHWSRLAQGSIALAAGLHPIRVGYFQEHNRKELAVAWEGPGIAWQPIPAAVLFHAPPVP